MLLYFVLSTLLGLSLCDFNILLLHTNDMHSHFQQTNQFSGVCEDDNSTHCYGGFARLRSEVDRRKREAAVNGRPTIFLNAGDSYQGTPFYTFFKWPIVSQLVSMLGIDVMSLGNHEFDDGVAGLVPFIQNVTVPIVCSNLNTSLEPSMNQPNLRSSIVLDVNGTKIGIIGYLTPTTKTLSSTGRVQILDEIPSIHAEAKNLLNQGVRILIALGHSGYLMDQEIAREVEDIDLVVGGHSHTFLYSGTAPDVEVASGPYPTVVTQASGKQVPVVQAYYATKYLGYLELDFDDLGNLKAFNGSPILLSENLPQDQDVLSALAPYEQQISDRIHKVLGFTEVLMDTKEMKCKLGECNLGNLITDAYVDYVARHHHVGQGWTLASVAIQQAGGIRASIDTRSKANRSITLEDMMTVLPWGDKVLVYNMTGRVLLEALEFSVARYEQTITGHVSEFLQLSGVQVAFDMNRVSGDRVVSVAVRCAECLVPEYQPLQLDNMYAVVVPEYLASGGDGFYMLINLTNPIVLDDVEYEIVSQYIQEHSPVYPAIEGRIFINTTKSASPASFVFTPWVIWSTLLLALFLTHMYFNLS